jgi:hypothetical protein
MKARQEIIITAGATLYHVFPTPDNNSYNLYVLKYAFRWPKKKISRKFIETHFNKYRAFYKSIPGNTVRELIKNMNYEKYILVQ